jgi:hypothetical protein
MVLKGDDAQDAVCTAVALGWQVARYAAQTIGEQTPLRVMQLGVSIAHLAPVFENTGLTAPDTKKLAPDPPEQPMTPDAFDGLCSDLLTAADFRVGKGYRIGRRLSVLRDAPETQDDIEHGLERLRVRVQDLRSVLKPHAAKAVIDGVDYWRDWFERWGKQQPEANNGAEQARAALPDQVRRWRSILSGEKDATDLLSTNDYVDAGSGLIEGYMTLGREYFRRWWPYFLTGAVIVVAIIVALLYWGKGGASTVAALATALAGLGVSVRSVTATLSKAAKSVEDDLMQADLDRAIGAAATMLPANEKADPKNLILYREQHTSTPAAAPAATPVTASTTP